jgi:hypothetical protein
VVVNIDETGSEDKAVGVDGRLVFFGLEFADADDVAENDADVGSVNRGACTVGDACVDDEEGARLLLGEEREESQKRDNGHGNERASGKIEGWCAKRDSSLRGVRSE